MILKNAKFKNYRNIEDESLNFSDEMNIIFGKNAQGKTNVIEGIYNFSNGKSFRKAKDKELIKFGEEESKISITFEDKKRDNVLEIIYNKEKRKECYVNKLKENKSSNFTSHFKSVLFCPEHLSIVKDEPQVRRTFVDSAIAQLRPLYSAYLSEYNKLNDEKNALLKNTEEYNLDFYTTYEILTKRMAKDVGYITCMRSSYLSRLFKNVNVIIKEISNGNEDISYNYMSRILYDGYDGLDKEENEKRYFSTVMDNIEKEVASKSCLYGVHKDDFDIFESNNLAKLYSSQGQQRSIALAMKLSEGLICFEETGEHPVFLFDDVLSELDKERKDYILSELKGRQVIITSCDSKDFENIENAKKIFAEKGKFKEF